MLLGVVSIFPSTVLAIPADCCHHCLVIVIVTVVMLVIVIGVTIVIVVIAVIDVIIMIMPLFYAWQYLQVIDSTALMF